MAKKTIALVHTTRLVIGPLHEALSKEFPDYKLVHLLDETLLEDFAKSGGTNSRVRRRLLSMVLSAEEVEPRLIVVTCSSLGDTVLEVQKFVDTPILKIDQPMAEEVVRCSRCVGLLATADSAIGGTMDLLKREAKKQGREIEFRPFVCADAGKHFANGMDAFNKYLSEEAAKSNQGVDALVVAQVSMCGLTEHLAPGELKNIFTALPFAVKKIKELLA